MVKLPEPGNTPVYPAGTYKVKMISYEFTEASTGTRQVKWKAEIEEPLAHKGRHITTYTALTEKAVWKASNLIGACGIKFDPNAIDTDSKDFDSLCHSTIGRSTYWLNAEGIDNKGNPRNDIVKFEIDVDQEVTEYTTTDDSPFKSDKEQWAEAGE